VNAAVKWTAVATASIVSGRQTVSVSPVTVHRVAASSCGYILAHATEFLHIC